MEAVFVFAVWLGILGLAGTIMELWEWIQERHEKAAAQRIRARRKAQKLPRKNGREDYWAA